MAKNVCSENQFCYCKALMAILIIVFVWMNVSWMKIGVTICAALIILSASGCCCNDMKRAKPGTSKKKKTKK